MNLYFFQILQIIWKKKINQISLTLFFPYFLQVRSLTFGGCFPHVSVTPPLTYSNSGVSGRRETLFDFSFETHSFNHSFAVILAPLFNFLTDLIQNPEKERKRKRECNQSEYEWHLLSFLRHWSWGSQYLLLTTGREWKVSNFAECI